MIPGSNLLDDALELIETQTIQLHKFSSRSENEIGFDVSVFLDPIDIEAQVQTVERREYTAMGLDFNNRYIMIWSSSDFEDLNRNTASDEITYNNDRYELMNEDDWTQIDGWNGALAIKIGPS